MMNRREFVAVFGGATIGLSPVGQAQHAKVPTIGALFAANPEPFLSEFKQALRDLRYVDGQNIRIEVRSAEGKPNVLASLASELVSLRVDLIVVTQTPAAHAAKQATTEIPIVMSGVGAPVETGLIASLARPGGNITGVTGLTAEIAGKTLELISETLPSAGRVAILANAVDPFTKPFLESLENAARTTGLKLRPIMIRAAEELAAAFREMDKTRIDAVIVQPSLPRKQAVDVALKHGLPTFSPTRAFPGEGGLMSYSASLADMFHKSAVYVDKILKGAKPADLPVQQPTKFQLVINLKTAKALGLTIPPSLLARADEIIE